MSSNEPRRWQSSPTCTNGSGVWEGILGLAVDGKSGTSMVPGCTARAGIDIIDINYILIN